MKTFYTLTGLLCTFLSVPQTSPTGTFTYLSDNGFPINFLENIVNSPIVQRKLKSRWKWEVWDVVPGVHSFQLYIFNITNPLEVLKGDKPLLQQVGPYYYRERRVKFDVSVNLDLTVNYERNFTYIFDPTKSTGTENDLVNVPNLPLIIFATIASTKELAKTNEAVNHLVASGESLISQGVRVGDLLFNGVDVSKYKKYLELLGPDTNHSELIEELEAGRYGLFSLKNGPHEHSFVIDSGLINQNNVGKIVSWNLQNRLNWWGDDKYCNMINGSDSSVFPPNLDKSTGLQVFDLDLCRSISFNYVANMAIRNVVQGWTFNIADNTLEDPKVYPPNLCYCKSPDQCLGRGVVDVSSCRGGAPFVMSYAHFFNADPSYLSAIGGLKPDSRIHQTQIDVEPVTGAVINDRKRLQWNILIKPLPQIDYFKNIKPIVFPLIWNDDAFQLNPDKLNLLMEELAGRAGGNQDVALNSAIRIAEGFWMPIILSSLVSLIVHVMNF